MTTIGPLANTADPTWQRYRDNFPRQALGINRYLEGQLMERLAGEYGFSGLRLYYEPYISLVTAEGTRLTDLAVALGISRQAANQNANQIEAAGYIERVPDPEDGRAKRVVLTPRGRELRQRGLELARRLEGEFSKVIGRGLMREGTAALVAFCDARGLLPPPPQPRERKQPSLVGLLPRFCDYVSQRLMALTAGRGHDGLKLSYGYVLALIGPQGGRILQIAELQNVSKQAVSAIANELEERGYIYREPDPANARQVLLRFTGFGRRLIEDSVRSIDDLEAEVRTTIGSGAFDALRTAMQQLYRDLQPEAAVFASAAPDIQQLAAELREKLPADARRQLAALLLR